MTGQKISAKKYCQGIEQVREAQSSRKKNDKAVPDFRRWLRKTTRAVGSRARLNQTQILVSRELPYFEFNNPINKMFETLVHFMNSIFLSPIIADTLIDVGNAKHQNSLTS